MAHRTLLVALASLALGCREAPPPPDAPRDASLPAPDALRITARVTRLLGVGWADVFDVELTGDRRGTGWVYAPAGDAFGKAVYAGDGGVVGRSIRLVVQPMPAVTAGDHAPYTLQLRIAGDGGQTFWSVASYEVR